MVTIEQAAAMAGVSSREIYQHVEAGDLHFMETADGSILVCFNALKASNLNTERTKL